MVSRDSNYSLSNMLRMVGMSFSMHDSIEPIMLISHILYPKNGTVGFVQRVLSLDYISIPSLVLGLDITSVVVLYTVLELIFRVGLKQSQLLQTIFEKFPKTHIMIYVDGGGVNHWSGVDNWSGMDEWSGVNNWGGVDDWSDV
jgi:hypothetical protein